MRGPGVIGTAIGALVIAVALGVGTASAGSTVTGDPAVPTTSARAAALGLSGLSVAETENAAAALVAIRYLGVPYVWGGASPSGFDCSGLPSYAYAQIGKRVPHYTLAIWNSFPKVAESRLLPGDLVFFHDLGHMGIYIGGGLFVHAPHTGDLVKLSDLATYPGYVGAVRP